MEGDPSRPYIPPMNVTANHMSRSPDQMLRVTLTKGEHRALIGLAVVGAATAAIGMQKGADGFWASWLLVAYYCLGLSLAGMCFVAIHYTTGASWSVAI